MMQTGTLKPIENLNLNVSPVRPAAAIDYASVLRAYSPIIFTNTRFRRRPSNSP